MGNSNLSTTAKLEHLSWGGLCTCGTAEASGFLAMNNIHHYQAVPLTFSYCLEGQTLLQVGLQ